MYHFNTSIITSMQLFIDMVLR